MPKHLLQLPPLSLYIHIPWCVKKCPYCDFNSHAQTEELPEEAYVQSLIRDLTTDLSLVQGRQLQSIFIGGGTPSLFSPQAIAQILSTVKQLVGFSSDIEITLEANPGTFEQEKFTRFREAGVNRLSIGIQSFNNQHLKALGRIHNAEEAIKAVSMAKQAGFNNFNLDLMHGLPQQNTDEAIADLQQAIELNPNHISWYQLTIEPNTVFYSKQPSLPEEGLLDDIQQQGHALLAEAGYQQYEVSAYAKGETASRHNINYWQFGDYLGIGAGAHGKITQPEHNTIVRTQKTRKPQDYLNAINFHKGLNPIKQDAIAFEFLMNALRLKQGVSTKLFEQRTGLPVASIETPWQQLQQQNLMQTSNSNLVTTPLGYQFLNTVLGYF